MPAQRLLVTEVRPGERLVDHRNGRGAVPVGFLEIAAGDDRNLHGFEELGADGQDAGLRTGRRVGHADRQPGPGSDERVFREGHVPHAGYRAEPSAQVAVEVDNLRVVVSGFLRIHLEQQHVVTVEAEFDRLQIRQGPHEESRGHRDDHGHGDLKCDEQVARANPVKHRQRTETIRAGPFSADIRSTRVASSAGARPKSTPVISDKRCRRRQHVPVHLRAQSEVRPAVCQQQRQEANAPECDEHPDDAAKRRKEDALCQQLADDAQAAGADAQAHRHFAPSGRRSRKQQMCDVGARQGEDESNECQQDVERLGILAAQTVEPPCALL